MHKVWIYSNFGYQLLGHIIERVSGMSYEDFVKKHIWSPIGINDIQVARPTLSQKSRLIYWFERIFFSNNLNFLQARGTLLHEWKKAWFQSLRNACTRTNWSLVNNINSL